MHSVSNVASIQSYNPTIVLTFSIHICPYLFACISNFPSLLLYNNIVMDNKFYPLIVLCAVLEKKKAMAEKIVFTNGCFDILHAGHIRYLWQARSLGDVLVVAINSDFSVGRLKPGRPIIPQADRAEVLAALRMVDYVTIFDEDTPYETIKAIKPHVLVKGGDWKIQDIVGADLVPEVHSVTYIEGMSTTAIINKIKGDLSD
ncbi:ADP-heptose synthase [Candidatus Magnetobacterium bavaricum]|uniref:D-glycero-beta-D-manno-heptose 1-phosphate adenylyltransferase n=1 Tax=Candidatus Magnetobacterium bavaricum TaxID=29290 RepID=A0A0F3GY65_9BACT|nr:ADP-heptose synthase [Candidatus Magnetobacterium bavaricum]